MSGFERLLTRAAAAPPAPRKQSQKIRALLAKKDLDARVYDAAITAARLIAQRHEIAAPDDDRTGLLDELNGLFHEERWYEHRDSYRDELLDAAEGEAERERLSRLFELAEGLERIEDALGAGEGDDPEPAVTAYLDLLLEERLTVGLLVRQKQRMAMVCDAAIDLTQRIEAFALTLPRGFRRELVEKLMDLLEAEP